MTMNRFAKYTASAIAMTVLMGIVSLWLAPQVAAQVRAALIKNVDEPGRSPYQPIELTAVDYGAYVHHVFPPVPAGKRLVVTYVGGWISHSANFPGYAYMYASAAVPSCCALPDPKLTLPRHPISGTFTHITGPVSFYVEEGLSPIVVSVVNGVPQFSGFSIVGYLIDKSL